ncbi:MAG: hypothetical protein ACI82Z_000182 [Cellvibrionaceae bacterium]
MEQSIDLLVMPIAQSNIYNLDFFQSCFLKKLKSTKNWASKTVLGERVFLNRDEVNTPENHDVSLHGFLNGISSVVLILAI